MRYEFGGVILVASLLVGCATSRPAATSRSSVDYNSYNEDLASVRPVYGTTKPATSSTPARPSTPVPSAPATVTPRKTEPRKTTGPVEALHVNRRLDLVLDTIATKNRSIRYAPGFRIQIYVGNQRQEADAAKLLIYQNYPELSPYLSYNQPTYKLKVGDFMRRMDAERYYASIRRLITSAQLQPDKVDVRRSLLIR
ncbi:SPOR domain-containing protein [Spirosoma fluminis]